MAFIGEGSTTTPTSTQTTIPQTAPDYWKKMQEELKKQQALQAAQQAAQQANSWWYQLTQVPANQAHLNKPAWIDKLNFWYKYNTPHTPSGVPQAAGGLSNWQYPSAYAFPQNQPGVNPADTYQNNLSNLVFNSRKQTINPGSWLRAYTDTGTSGNPFPAPQGINPNFWINAYTDTNTDDYGLPAMSPETPSDPGSGGYVAPEYPAWSYGGGGGGGRRSSSSVGRSKQLASWYQAMTNWNINRPQSG